MSEKITYTAKEALEKLMNGNIRYLSLLKSEGDVSPALREKTCAEGQRPYAIIITCSDSRVLPESIFNAGIGELFVIRVAGNVIDNHQLGSIEYAAEHLGCRLIVVMGHNHCGAVDAAINHDPEGYIKFITDEISKAIGDETDDYAACCLNVRHSVETIEESLEIRREEEHGLRVLGALYHLEDGRVEFMRFGKGKTE
ncbi:MAG: carbonic anhydrase [Oscillospiraceae bacterium]|nr:carbonic anhydrase [Oscillospiraceae bacterium]